MRRSFLLFIAIVLYTIGPILCVLIAALIANALGCQLDESGAHPCKCLGVDIGEPLAAMGVMGWLALVTLPTGGLALIAFLIYAAAASLLARADNSVKPEHRE